jgi:hypothetical protein
MKEIVNKDLKKCPFCGKGAYIWHVSDHQFQVSCQLPTDKSVGLHLAL